MPDSHAETPVLHENTRASTATSSSQPRSPESRLRILMNDQTATVEQLTDVVCATEAVVAEMRREMASKRLREKIAASEVLFNAIGSSDVDRLTAALL